MPDLGPNQHPSQESLTLPLDPDGH